MRKIEAAIQTQMPTQMQIQYRALRQKSLTEANT
jgi:hypothetical protein